MKSIFPAGHFSQITRRKWDVAVIGAGPSGATAARLLARQGHSVLLIEKKAFPREKVCGACLNGRALSVLKWLGLPDLVQRLAAVPVRDFALHGGGSTVRVPLPCGVAVSRSAFDWELVKEAVCSGVDFLPETTATVHAIGALGDTGSLRPRGHREIRLSRGANESMSLSADVVIAADGLGHPSLRSLPEFANRVMNSARIGVGACIAADVPDYPPGTIFMGVGRGGYVGLVRVEDRRLNVAAAVDAALLKGGGNIGQVVSQLMTEAGLPIYAEMASATWHGTPRLTQQSQTVAAQRVFLIGDAAGYVEPFTGEGMSAALSMGAAVVPFISAALAGGLVEAEWGWRGAHRRLVTRRARWCRSFVWASRRPFVTNGLIRALNLFPRLSQPVVHQLNAPVNPTEISFA